MQIDHVLFGVQDLADAASWFDDSFGLRAVTGGTHPHFGTANAVIPVGNGQYVELIAVVDRRSEHPLARFLASAVQGGDRPVAVCLRPDDLDATARRLSLDVTDAERAKPDGSVVRWRMAGIEAALGPDRLPFFIEWPGGRANPELAGESTAGAVAWVEVGGDPDTLRQWVGDELAALVSVDQAPGIGRFGVQRSDGSTSVIGAR